jgi:aspartyl-tRNA(Asn)/glutamyl-tRNA(Gln) amidotransferase subunit B
MTSTRWQPVIGLELHVQLNTRSKLFCADSVSFAGAPNTRISEISLGYPGTLPCVNKAAIQKAVMLGLACGSKVNTNFYFERKNYTYPDLPKGYQLTQSRAPVCLGGSIPIRLQGQYNRAVALLRIQLEEDAGKSLHDVYDHFTALDFNRAGTPLLEVVTQPVMHSPEEAAAAVAELRRLVRWLNISDGNMEQASLRCDANISMRPAGTEKLGTRVEIKNLNSIRFLQQALLFEIQRQTDMLNSGQQVVQETRLFNPATGETLAMRTKEDLNDYRYFPEPDIPPVVLAQGWIDAQKQSLPELPAARYSRYMAEYNLNETEASMLTEEPPLACLFDETLKHGTNPKKAANWITGPVRTACQVGEHPLPGAAQLADLISLVEEGAVNFSAAAQHLLPFLLSHPGAQVRQAARELGLIQTAQEEVILPLVQEVITAYPDKLMAYHKGKKGLIGFFMSEIQKRSSHRLNPSETRAILERLLRN